MTIVARLTTVGLTALLALSGLLALSTPAHAEAGYRFWGYYHLAGGEWTASQKGADAFTPKDGAVEGFRYATTTQTQFERPPRAVPTFAEICADTEAAQGEKRVALVIDYGTPQDATGGAEPPQPEAACAAVPADATTQQALESVRPLRVDQIICAIDGYPASGCAQEVADATVPKNEQPVDLALPSEQAGETSQSAFAWPLVGVGALVLLLGGGAVALARRRRG